MKYDFDTIIDRKDSNCYKWHDCKEKDIIPMWVADMDFRTAEPIIEALRKRVEHGVFGYGYVPKEFYDAEILWWKKRHGFEIMEEWIEYTTGVIPALSGIVQAFTKPGDDVLIQSPVYNYFNTSIVNNKCNIITNNLIYSEGKYTIDFEDFEKKVSGENTKMFILCNPHNPVGRVWNRDELERMAELCLKHNVIMVSDEIHRDLVFKGSKYTPVISLGEKYRDNTITCTAPSKTFNLAGLKTANIIVSDPEKKKKINRSLNINETAELNVFGIDGLIAAYTEGDEWLEQAMEYIEGNRDYLEQFIKEKLPMLKVIHAEGTYLAWIDIKELRIDSGEFVEMLLKKGNLWINNGAAYGPGGEGFIRINTACSRKLMEAGLERLYNVIKSNFAHI